MHLYLFKEFFSLSEPEQELQLLALSRWDYPSVQIICFRHNPDHRLQEKWMQWFQNATVRTYWQHPLLHPLDYYELITRLLSESASIHVVCCTRLRWKTFPSSRSGASAPLLHFNPKRKKNFSLHAQTNGFAGPHKKRKRKSSR